MRSMMNVKNVRYWRHYLDWFADPRSVVCPKGEDGALSRQLAER
jgi:hypothetical protein